MNTFRLLCRLRDIVRSYVGGILPIWIHWDWAGTLEPLSSKACVCEGSWVRVLWTHSCVLSGLSLMMIENSVARPIFRLPHSSWCRHGQHVLATTTFMYATYILARKPAFRFKKSPSTTLLYICIYIYIYICVYTLHFWNSALYFGCLDLHWVAGFGLFVSGPGALCLDLFWGFWTCWFVSGFVFSLLVVSRFWSCFLSVYLWDVTMACVLGGPGPGPRNPVPGTQPPDPPRPPNQGGATPLALRRGAYLLYLVGCFEYALKTLVVSNGMFQVCIFNTCCIWWNSTLSPTTLTLQKPTNW